MQPVVAGGHICHRREHDRRNRHRDRHGGTPRIAAVILAGGKGERLGGVIKANLEIGGVRLLDRVTEAMTDVASPILVAHGGLDPVVLHLTGQHVPIPDLPADHAGPLAGVAAAIAWCCAQPEPPEYLASLAVDTPFFPHDFIGKAITAIGSESSAIIARYGTQDYPTNALWRLSAVAALPARIADGTAPHSLKRLAAELEAKSLEWPASAAGDPFVNANTPADLLALEARAAARG
ncbi:MAG: molybdenum cofactor guanylyltransferase [Devosia sp.]|nr:molybdenum cofactor guanylyltransferase [Devosia sp.]